VHTRLAVILFAGSLCVVGLAFSPRPTAPKTATKPELPVASPPGARAMKIPTTLCACYYASDCRTRNALCNYSGSCLPQGKNHGLCDLVAPPPSTNLDAVSNENRGLVVAERIAISSAVDSYFQGFMKAIENGGGHPDPKLVRAALDIRLSQNLHDRVELAVWVSLDAVMGWDFEFPLKFQRAEGFMGNVRDVGGVRASGAIVDAARRGLLDALKTGDSSKVVPPLQEFWSKNPNYMPRHLGRCYPHGHPELTDMTAGIACQIDVLQRAAGMLIDSAGAEAAQVSAPEEMAAPKCVEVASR
jgi:hypothetical protein